MVSLPIRHLTRVRRTFTRDQLDRAVGWAGSTELHRLDCVLYLTEVTVYRVAGGPLRQVFAALAEDYEAGLVPFPALHACLRDPLVPLQARRSTPAPAQRQRRVQRV